MAAVFAAMWAGCVLKIVWTLAQMSVSAVLDFRKLKWSPERCPDIAVCVLHFISVCKLQRV